MDAVVKEEKNMIEPKEEVEDTVGLKEPKVELLDEMDVKMEEIDDTEYQHMIPYEYRDYMEQHEQKEPGNSRKRQAEKESQFKKEKVECQVCMKTFVIISITNAEKHAATHTNIKRFSCPVDECDYKSDVHHNVIQHMKQKHKMVKPYVKDVVRRELSDDEKEQLRKVMEDCFPGVTRRNTNRKTTSLHKFTCQLCYVSISELGFFWTSRRRSHAFTHTDIMIYKCIELNCDFKTKYSTSLRQHHKYKRGKNPEMVSKKKHQISPEEDLKMKKIAIQCFPELKELEDKTETIENVQSNANERRKRCDVCYKTIHTNDLKSKIFRQFHAWAHTGIMTYKCCQEDCDYKARNHDAMITHQKLMHRMNMNEMPVKKIELTNEQEMEIRRMMFRCFPEWIDD